MNKIKEAKNKFKDQELKVDGLVAQMQAESKEMSRLAREYHNLLNASRIKVSDHAVLRWLERMEGVDVDAIRHKIVDEEIERAFATLGGNGTFPSGDKTYRVRIQDNTIVTVIPETRSNNQK